VESSCECGSETSGFMKCWQSNEWLHTTGGLSSGAQRHRISLRSQKNIDRRDLRIQQKQPVTEHWSTCFMAGFTRPPLWFSGQSSLLHTQRSRVRLPAL
jgi:hypothetical protein